MIGLVKYTSTLKFLYSVFLRSSLILSALIVFMISSYIYGPAGRGVISFVGSFYFSISLLFSFGLSRIAYQKITSKQEDAEFVLPIAIAYVVILSIAGVLVLAFLSSTPQLSKHLPEEVTLDHFRFFYGWFVYNVWLNFSNFLFSAVGRTDQHDKLIFFTRILQVAILAVLAALGINLEFFLLSYSISCVAVVLVEIYFLVGPVGLKKVFLGSRRIPVLFQNSFWPYMDNIAQAAHPLVIFIIGLSVSSSDLGYYHFTLQILSGLLFPFVVMQTKIQEWLIPVKNPERVATIKKYLRSAFLLGVLLSGLGAIVPLVLPVVGLKSFIPSMPILKVLLGSVPLYAMYLVFLGSLVALHLPKVSSASSYLYGTVATLVALLLAPRIGIWSGPVGTYLGLMVVLAYNFFTLDKYTRKS